VGRAFLLQTVVARIVVQQNVVGSAVVGRAFLLQTVVARIVVQQSVVGSAVVGRAFLLQTVVARIVVQQSVVGSAVVARAAVEPNWDLHTARSGKRGPMFQRGTSFGTNIEGLVLVSLGPILVPL
jgi:hypothetical protein